MVSFLLFPAASTVAVGAVGWAGGSSGGCGGNGSGNHRVWKRKLPGSPGSPVLPRSSPPGSKPATEEAPVA